MKLDHFVAHRLMPFCREQLMSNIVREWCKLSNSICPTRVFTIDNRIWRSNGGGGGVIKANSLQQNDVETVANYYSNGIAQWIGGRSTFGIVHRYFVEKNPQDASSDSGGGGGQFLWQRESPYYTGISLVLCCAKEETLQLQQALTRQRHHWYRRLSKSPLNSGFKLSLAEEDSKNNRINIVYQPKQVQVDGADSIQLDSIILNNTSEATELKKEDPRLTETIAGGNRDIIICRSNLDNVLGAFLDDAYTLVKADDGDDESEQIILKLNPSLVPFKLAFTFEEEHLSSSVRSRLNELTNYLISNLQDYSDISIFPFVGPLENGTGTDDHSLLTPSKSDQLAVQYCAILREETLENGLIWLRNRDTRISETIHLSNFVKTILFYLQPERLINSGATFEQQQQPQQQSTAANIAE